MDGLWIFALAFAGAVLVLSVVNEIRRRRNGRKIYADTVAELKELDAR